MSFLLTADPWVSRAPFVDPRGESCPADPSKETCFDNPRGEPCPYRQTQTEPCPFC